MAGRSLGAPEIHDVVELAGREHRGHQLGHRAVCRCTPPCSTALGLINQGGEGQVGSLKVKSPRGTRPVLMTRAGDAHRAQPETMRRRLVRKPTYVATMLNRGCTTDLGGRGVDLCDVGKERHGRE